MDGVGFSILIQF